MKEEDNIKIELQTLYCFRFSRLPTLSVAFRLASFHICSPGIAILEHSVVVLLVRAYSLQRHTKRNGMTGSLWSWHWLGIQKLLTEIYSEAVACFLFLKTDQAFNTSSGKKNTNSDYLQGKLVCQNCELSSRLYMHYKCLLCWPAGTGRCISNICSVELKFLCWNQCWK